MPELGRPLMVRFWIASPEQASALVDATVQAARECAARPEAGDFGATAVDFEWGGWRGVQSLVTNPTSSDNGDPETTAALVAARGALLAEASWSWSIEEGAREDRHWLRQGDLAAETVLAAVGGDPARPAPSMPSPRASISALAAALPPVSTYGKDAVLWPGTRNPVTSTDLACTTRLDKRVDAGAPATTRRVSGDVSVSEVAVVLADEPAAEQARRSLLVWDGPRDSDGRPLVRPCSWDDGVQRKFPPDVTIPLKVEPFRRGTWSGEVETFAVRRPDLPRKPTYRDSVAHVAVAVRHGRTVVYLRWQGPAGSDLRGALRRGRAAVIHTLDLLPTA